VRWKSLPDQRAHRRLGGAVRGGDRIETDPAAFIFDAERRAKERQDRCARDACKFIHELGEIDCRHAAPRRPG
jgi:hypothetical protein